MPDQVISSPAVDVVPCKSWEHFKESVHASYVEEIEGHYPVFRGHARPTWRLASQWERKLAESSARRAGTDKSLRDLWADVLEKILQDFKELASGLPGIRSRELEELDWWSVGRHFGLVTPLLDWTRSPYVAAFFAFASLAEELSPGVTTRGAIEPRAFLEVDEDLRVAIWAFRVEKDMETDPHLEVLNPRVDIGHRQRAQRGLFTRLEHSSFFDVESYLESLNFDRPPLTQFLVPGTETAKAITELRMMNITFATLFPDLEGAALQANFETVSHSLMGLSAVGFEEGL